MKNRQKNKGKIVDKYKKPEYNIHQLATANHSKSQTNIRERGIMMNLREAQIEKEYVITKIDTDDEELKAFLFSLGCYSGEAITVVRRLKGGCVVAIKDGRYNIDNQLAEAIIV